MYIFREPKYLEANVKVELDLSNYVTKADLKNAAGVDTSDFAKKTDLASLKSDVDKLDIDKLKNVPNNLSILKSRVDKLDTGKLKTAPVDLSKLSNVVKIHVVKKSEYDELVKQFNAIQVDDANNSVKKTDYKRKLMKLKKKNDQDHTKTYITTQELNKLTSEHFAARLALVNLASKNDTANFLKKERL